MAFVLPIFEYEIEVCNFAIQGKDRDKFRSIQGNCLKRGYFHGEFGAIERLNLLRALTPLLCQSHR